MALADLFRKKTSGPSAQKRADRGLLVFEHTSEVIRAEKLLKESGREIRVMGPPPEIQRGCDLVVEFPLMERLDILRILDDAGTPPLESVPVSGPLLDPVNLYQVKDFGDHLMVRAANMKLTVDKRTRVIVNVSGGGCPDVPYIAARLIGRTLDEAPAPREIGHTLCGYALELAHAEMVRLCSS
ncbi:DUF3343 domain-containing protein [uncultured Pseudodesulfovibrio sp.]|uniref:DUF3343 domain-containing protein n=1 Tax=uncultured Pseudodesulfovibrio sp. TaxID=2035858 RepID=UPI0029C7C651|nr:DUF3343 domain-containing protein [uncultured Pseudodesulfovibrio sp.]